MTDAERGLLLQMSGAVRLTMEATVVLVEAAVPKYPNARAVAQEMRDLIRALREQGDMVAKEWMPMPPDIAARK